MPRLQPGRSHWDLILKVDTDRPIYLTFDRSRAPKKPYEVSTTYVPAEPGVSPSLREWYWQNGRGGAGTSVETPENAGSGASEYGAPAWFRRKGVWQPPGALVEVSLPGGTAGLRSGQLDAARMYNGDLFITTRRRYVVRVPGAGTTGLTEQDCGVGTTTAGIDVFSYGGAAYLEVGTGGGPLYEFNGTTWTAGEALTQRGWLATPYWTIGSQLATGGAVGTAGSGATRLVGTDLYATGFRHCAGDPKIEANWSALTRIGTGATTYPIARIIASNRTVFFSTGQGVYGVDGLGYSPNLTQWVEATASIFNGQATAYWNGLIWYGHEDGLVAMVPDGERKDVAIFMNFGTGTGALPIFGRPQVLAPSPQGLLVGYYNAADQTSYVGCLLADPDGSYRWSMAEAVIPGEVVSMLHQASTPSGDPGLFIGTGRVSDGSLHLYRQYLPRYGGDPETDAAHLGPFRAQSDWSVRSPRWNGRRGVPNTLRRLALETRNLGASYPDNTVDVQLANDNGAFVSQGVAPSTDDALQTRWTATPVSGSVRATNSQVRLAVHNAATAPVVIDAVSVLYTQRPERTAFATYRILISEGQGVADPWATFRRLERTQQEDPIRVEDQFGRTAEMLVEDLSLVSVEEAPGKGWAIHADLTLSTTRRVTLYDNGALMDAGEGYA